MKRCRAIRAVVPVMIGIRAAGGFTIARPRRGGLNFGGVVERLGIRGLTRQQAIDRLARLGGMALPLGVPIPA